MKFHQNVFYLDQGWPISAQNLNPYFKIRNFTEKKFTTKKIKLVSECNLEFFFSIFFSGFSGIYKKMLKIYKQRKFSKDQRKHAAIKKYKKIMN